MPRCTPPSFATSCLALVLLAPGAVAGSLTTLHDFTGPDGAFPYAAVTVDANDDIYVETYGGTAGCSYGNTGCGTLARLAADGQETTLVTFTGANGAFSNGPVTVVGRQLFGTAETGTRQAGVFGGAGVVFAVHTDGSAFSIVHQFTNRQGISPSDRLLLGQDGAFYSDVRQGGPYYSHNNPGYGAIFRLTRSGQYTTLHDFTGGADGAYPDGLVMDASGTLYGATEDGACPQSDALTCATIFRYVPGSEAFSVLYQFPPSHCVPSLAAVAPDGTLYGSTRGGGANGQGSLFALRPNGAGYRMDRLFSFAGGAAGGSPLTPPVLTQDGALIGTAGGAVVSATAYHAVLYRFSQGAYSILYTFSSNRFGKQPADAESTPAVDHHGQIVGATPAGGFAPCLGITGAAKTGCGTLYRWAP